MRKTLKISLLAGFAAAQLLAGSAAFARRGADDPAGHVRQCRGCDDAPGDVRQGRGADDPAGHVRQGRGADDPAGDDSGRGRGRGTDDGPNHT